MNLHKRAQQLVSDIYTQHIGSDGSIDAASCMALVERAFHEVERAFHEVIAANQPEGIESQHPHDVALKEATNNYTQDAPRKAGRPFGSTKK